jgi:hypothetical protein
LGVASFNAAKGTKGMKIAKIYFKKGSQLVRQGNEARHFSDDRQDANNKKILAYFVALANRT